MTETQINITIGVVGILVGIILFYLGIYFTKKNLKNDKVFKLENEVIALKEAIKLRDRIEIRDGVTYHKQKNGVEVVICPKCFSNNSAIPIPMRQYDKAKWVCDACQYSNRDTRFFDKYNY